MRLLFKMNESMEASRLQAGNCSMRSSSDFLAYVKHSDTHLKSVNSEYSFSHRVTRYGRSKPGTRQSYILARTIDLKPIKRLLRGKGFHMKGGQFQAKVQHNPPFMVHIST